MRVLLKISVVGVSRGSVTGRPHNRGYPRLTFHRPTQTGRPQNTLIYYHIISHNKCMSYVLTIYVYMI